MILPGLMFATSLNSSIHCTKNSIVIDVHYVQCM